MSLRMITGVAIGIAIVQSGIVILEPPLQWLIQALWSVLLVMLARAGWHRMTRRTQHRTIRTLGRIPPAVAEMLEKSDQQ